MAIRKVDAGDSEKIVNKDDIADKKIQIMDGAAASITPSDTTAAEAGDVLEPGREVILEPMDSLEEHLHAIGDDLLYQMQDLEEASSGGGTRRVRSDTAELKVARKVARDFNVSPGAGSDIFAADIDPPATGTFRVEVVPQSSTTVQIHEKAHNGTGHTFTYGVLDGRTLDGGEGYTFSHSVRQDTDYNYQIGSDVTLDKIQVDFSAEARL